jgi:hypothetical protein
MCYVVHKQAKQPDRNAATDTTQRRTAPPQRSGHAHPHGRSRMRHRRRCSSLRHVRLRHPLSRGATSTMADWRYADAACFSRWLRMLMLDASRSITEPPYSPKLPQLPLPGPDSASTSRRLVYSTPPLLSLLLQLDVRDRTAARGGDVSSGETSVSMVNNKRS